MKKIKVMTVFGTRPEAIKMAPVVLELKKYPDLIMPVVFKPYGRFNQSISDNAILVEVGSNGTTSAEAQASAKYLAEILDGYFKEQDIKNN